MNRIDTCGGRATANVLLGPPKGLSGAGFLGKVVDLKRVRAQRSGQPPKKKHNWVNKTTRESRQRSHLLDKRRANYFRYDLEDLVQQFNLPEEVRAGFVSGIISRGQRQSVEDAKAFVKEKREEGLIGPEIFEHATRLIERYSLWR